MSSELSPDELRTLRSFFLDEATEHLEAVERALTSLEASPDDAVALAALLRRLHTLKGSAGSVELDELSHDAHAAEDRVVALRDARRAPTEAELAELVRAVEAVRARVAEVVRLVHGAVPPPRSQTPLPRKSPAPPKREITQPRGEVMQIRVEVGQVDELMDAVARLLIDRTRLERRLSQLDGCVHEVARVKAALRGAGGDPARLAEVDAEFEEAVRDLERAGAGLSDDAELLGQTSRALQEGLQRVRMMEVGRLFARVATPLREMARRAGKQVELTTSGERTAIDKAVVERIVDPLLHLLRNAVAHGIERSDERLRAGKPAAGQVEIAARQRGDQIILEVADDGAGVDLERVRGALQRARRLSPKEARALGAAELTQAIFDPGISTREEVDDLAGRGVGLDVVKEAIERLGGVIRCSSSPGRGTRFAIQLPLTTAIAKALLFKVGGHVYAVPSSSVVETAQVSSADVVVGEAGEQVTVRGRALPLVRLGALLGEPPPPGTTQRRAAVVLEHDGEQLAMTCDKLIGPREIVVKGLGPLLAPLTLFAGATISGAGKVQLILDVETLAELAGRSAPGARPTGRVGGPRVLVADDSRSLRETAALMLMQGGYRVETVPDGWEAWELLQDRTFDLLLTDGEMPRLDGYELTARVRRAPALRELPVVVMTSRLAEAMRVKALQAGATAFLPKPLRRKALLELMTEILRTE